MLFYATSLVAKLPRILHGLEGADEIAARQLLEIGVRPAALHQLGENPRKAGDVLQALALWSAEEIRADAEVIRADLRSEIIEVVAIFGERAARPRTELALARRHDLIHIDAARCRAVLVFQRLHPVARFLRDEIRHEGGHDHAAVCRHALKHVVRNVARMIADSASVRM